MSRFALRGDCHDEWKAKFHDVVYHHFNEISSRFLEFDLSKQGNIRGVTRCVTEREFDLTLANDRRLIGRDEANGFGERSNPGCPAIENTKFECGDGDFRYPNQANNADDDEVAIGFLTHVFTEKRALKVG